MIIGPLLITAALVARQPPAVPASTMRPYGHGSVLISHHPANGARLHRVAHNLGGNTWTLSGGAGAWLSPSIGLEGEFAIGGTVSAPQDYIYFTSEYYTAQHRDLLLNQLIRYRPRGRGPIHLLAGAGYARTTAKHVSVVISDSFGRRTVAPDSASTVNSFSVTAGVDVIAAATSRVAVAPAFRLRWTRRPAAGASGWTGIGGYSLQFGAALQIR